ncbi:MAG: hypothetical protein ACLP1X_32685 [Polyangiaceae bacterium]
MRNDLRVPHFLRVTQALAFVSGFGLPLTIGCGGNAISSPAGTESDSSSLEDTGNADSPGPFDPYDGSPLGLLLDDSGGGGIGVPPPYDGGPKGVMGHPDASVAYDGGVTGVGIYDGGPTGVVVHPDASMAYDGGPTGVIIYDGGPLGIIVAPDAGHVLGGPLLPPELPA